jgi:hypothetical protein
MPYANRFSTSLILSAALGVAFAAQSIPATPAKSQMKGKSQTSTESSLEEHPAKTAQLPAMQADAKKMRVILNQMRTNLAFVQSTQTPLKHQFELEIDMWQTLLDQMDRRIREMEHSTGTKPAQ